MDEVCLNLTHWTSVTHKSVIEIWRKVEELRREVVVATKGLTCSAVIGMTAMISKIASDMNKPDAQTIVLPNESNSFLLQLKVRDLKGIGSTTAQCLKSLKIETVADLRERAGAVQFCLPAITARNLLRLSVGQGIHVSESRRTIGYERTFQPSAALPRLCAWLTRIADQLWFVCNRECARGQEVTVCIVQVEDDTLLWRRTCAVRVRAAVLTRFYHLDGSSYTSGNHNKLPVGRTVSSYEALDYIGHHMVRRDVSEPPPDRGSWA